MSNRPIKLLGLFATIVAVVIGWWVWRGSSERELPAPNEPGERAARAGEQPEGRSPEREQASIAGAVLARDELGKAVAGARVCVWAIDPGRGRVVELASVRCTVTGPDGRYRVAQLEAGRYRVTAGAMGLLPAVWVDAEHDQREWLALGVGEARAGVDLALGEGGVTLAGTVVDVSGGPVESAIVVASGPGWMTNNPVATAVSDEQGRFSMRVRGGEYRLRAEGLGYAPTSGSARAPNEAIELRLTPESVLVGHVIDEAGDPVPGVTVRAGPRHRHPVAISDEQGRFRLGGLPPGLYQPEGIGERVYGQATRPVYVGLGETSDPIELRVHPAHRVRGQIVAHDIRSGDERGCAKGRVGLHGGGVGRSGVADDEGWVELLGVPAGRHELSVHCSGAVEGLDAKLEVAADLDEQRWVLDVGGYRIAGRVIDASGRGLEDVFVDTTGADVERGVSGSEGEFELLVSEPGSYTLTAKLRGQLHAAATVELEVSDDVEGVELDVGEVAALRGRVVDGEGRPVDGIRVALCDARPSCANQATSDGEGVFGFEALAVGRWWAVLAKDMPLPGTENEPVGEPVEVVAGELASVTLVTEVAVGAIRGTVESEGGPATDAWVVASRGSVDSLIDDWEIGPVLCDVDGSFTFDGLGEGTWAVRAFRREGGEASVGGVELGSTVVLELGATASLAGRVYMPNGSPPTQFELLAESEGRRRRAQFFRSEGEFELVELPAGKWRLSFTANIGSAELSVALEAGQQVDDLDVELEPRVSIRGRAVDSRSGEPVTGVTIRVKSGSAFSRAVQPDEDGRFELSGVPPGRVPLDVFPRNWGDRTYGMQFPFIDVATEPAVQDVGDVLLAGSSLEPGETPGDLGFVIELRGYSDDGATVDEQYVVVAKVRADGPAAAAGLQIGDVLTAFDGFSIEGRRAAHASRYLKVAAGDTVVLSRRDADEVTIVAVPQAGN